MISKYIIKLSGISGILLFILTIIVISLAIQNAPWFSWTENAISDLGRPEYGLSFFNYILTTIGVLLLIFSFGLYYSLKGERAGPTVLALSSIYFIGIGIYPLPNPNHVDVSGLFFIAFPLAFFILGLGFQRYKKDSSFFRKMGIYALIIAVISVVSPALLFFYNGVGVSEAVIMFPGFLWCMRYGVYLLRLDK